MAHRNPNKDTSPRFWRRPLPLAVAAALAVAASVVTFTLTRNPASGSAESFVNVTVQELAAATEPALAFRRLPPSTPTEIEQVERLAHRQFERIRRFSLPRKVLGRALELALVLDRAVALEEDAYRVDVKRLFDAAVSPRNLGILAHPPNP